MKIKIAKGGVKLGTWNHRVVMKRNANETWLEIVEVHYDENGKLQGWSEARGIHGETRQQLLEALDRMIRAVRKPILVVVGKKLIEARPGAKEAHGAALKDLNEAELAGLRTIRNFLHSEFRD